MKEICFATNNQGKLIEIQSLLKDVFVVKSLHDIGCNEEIVETGITLFENAKIKAQYIYEKYHINCFADDSGLVVNSLNGDPGVYSARYAGVPVDNEKNIDLLLQNMNNKSDRNAHFSTVICLVVDGLYYFFEGKIDGEIVNKKDGNEGFGYDPIFKPNGYDRTFAHFSKNEKNAISHRGLAVRKMVDFLEKLF